MKNSLKIRSIKLNFFLNNIRLFLNLLVPLIVFPYVSRVLGPEGLGKVEFANSIVSYFVLFTALGIPTYGVREIARRRDDPEERSRVVWELTWILAGTAAAGYAAYFALVNVVPALRESRALFLVLAPAIFLSCFNYEWFYTGIEDQLYITIRFIIVKVAQAALIFLCVKQAGDFVVYAGILTGANGLSALFNMARLRRYVRWAPLRTLNIRRHVKAIVLIFASLAAVNVYLHMDVTMVGTMAGDEAVGLYTAANRIVRMVIMVVTSLATVMIPRIENALKNEDREAYRKYLGASLRFVMLLGVPCCFGILILAPEIIKTFAGARYNASIVSIRLLSPVIIIVGLANFVGLQVLYPNRRERDYTIAVSVAAAVNGVFNALMIPRLAQNGAILGTVLAEAIGLGIQVCLGRQLLRDTKAFSWDVVKYLIAGGVMAAALLPLRGCAGKSPYLALPLCVAVGAAVYALALAALREQTVWAV